MFLDARQPRAASEAAALTCRGTADSPPRSHRLRSLRPSAGPRAAHERGILSMLVRGSAWHRGSNDRGEDRHAPDLAQTRPTKDTRRINA